MGDVDYDYTIKDIEKHATVDGTIKNVKVSRLTAPGENYISLVLRVDFETEKNGTTKTINAIAKRIPLGDRKLIDLNQKAMSKEIRWYSEVVPILKKFAEEQGIGGMDFYPEQCGFRYSMDPGKREADRDSFLLLENLIVQGYKNEDRFTGFNLTTTKAILKKLALFHTIPLVMKFKNPKLFKLLMENVGGPATSDVSLSSEEAKTPADILLEKLLDMPECSHHIEKIKELSKRPRKGPFVWNTPATEPWSTIIHTDFWVNNIMIKHRENKEPLVKMVDFQMCMYGSFAKDLVFFLLTSVNNDVTREYLDDILKFYYEEFMSTLKEAKVDLELTYTAFLKEVRRITLESEYFHVLFFMTVIFGEKGSEAVDLAVEDFDPIAQFAKMLQNLNKRLKEKLILVTCESADRNWI